MREEPDHPARVPAPTVLPPDWIDAYRKYHRFWVNLARSSSLSEEDAQDIVHGVIASALVLDRSRFESLEHIRNYIARGVLNRSIQLHQRGGRCTEFTERTDLMIADRSDEPNHDERLLRAVLIEGLEGLPKKDFEIVKLRFYGGLTFQEISDLLHLPVSTLKSREDSAMKKLRRWFQKRGVTNE
jgi:RNA polymerase sigma-70 factor (ECF subfamily)